MGRSGPRRRIHDGSEPWRSYDYDYIADDVTTVITYEQVATASVQAMTVEIFYRDPSQAPEIVDGERQTSKGSRSVSSGRTPP